MRTTKENKVYKGRDLEAMSFAQNYYDWLIKEFKDYIGENVAEVGAGSGNFSEYILKSKSLKNFVGIEPVPEMYELLKEKLSTYPNSKAVNGFFGDVYRSLNIKFDTIFYINVLEHVQYDSEELKHAYDALNKGGYLCIYVPAIEFLMGTFDHQVGHYRRYSSNQLKSVLKGAGFEVMKIHYSDMIGILPWILMFKILKRQDLNSGSVSTYDKFVIPVISLIEKFVKPPIGKNLFAFARKPV